MVFILGILHTAQKLGPQFCNSVCSPIVSTENSIVNLVVFVYQLSYHYLKIHTHHNVFFVALSFLLVEFQICLIHSFFCQSFMFAGQIHTFVEFPFQIKESWFDMLKQITFSWLNAMKIP